MVRALCAVAGPLEGAAEVHAGHLQAILSGRPHVAGWVDARLDGPHGLRDSRLVEAAPAQDGLGRGGLDRRGIHAGESDADLLTRAAGINGELHCHADDGKVADTALEL